MSREWNDAQDFVSLCKGARASIILLFIFADGRSLTKEDVCSGVGYSDKPVKSALDWLEARGIVQYNGHLYGYSLSSGVRQLDFIRQLGVDKHRLPPPVSGLATGSAYDTVAESADASHDEAALVTPEFGASSHDDAQQTTTGDAVAHDANDVRRNSDISESFRTSPHVCMFKHKTKSLSDEHTKHESPNPRKISDLRCVLELVGLSGPNLDKYSQEDIPLSWPLAWWFDLQNQPWRPDNAAGWIFKRLKDGKEPKPEFISDSEAHLRVWQEGGVLELPVIDSSCESTVDKLIQQGVIQR